MNNIQEGYQYRKIFHHIRDAIIVVNSEQHIIECNAAFTSLFGYTPEELYGKHPGYIYSQGQVVNSLVEKAQSNPKEQHEWFTFFYKKKDGSVFPGETKVISLNDENVEESGFIGIIRDVSEKRDMLYQLSGEEQKFRTIFHNCNDPIFIHRLDGNFLEVNDVACQLLGYTREELLQMGPQDIDTTEYVPLISQRIQTIKEQGHLIFESAHIRKDGSVLPLQINSRIFTYQDNKCIISIGRDLTGEKKAKAQLNYNLRFFEQIIETIPYPIFYRDQHDIYLLCNKAHEHFTGCSRSQLIGHKAREVLKNNLPSSYFQAEQTALQAQGEHQFEGQFCRDNGEKRDVIIKEASLKGPNNMIEGTIGIILDLTGYKNVERGIIRNLEKERELNQLRSGFISLVSHEFRTPLSNIYSNVQLLEKYDSKWDEEKKKARFKKIYNSISVMLKMLEEISIVNKSDMNKIQYKPQNTQLDQFCNQVIEEITNDFPDRTIDVHKECLSRQVIFDPYIFRYIITNILTNALKYSAKESPVKCYLACHQQQLQLEVQDYGIGIPVEYQDTIFNPFQRAPNVKHIKGTGIGMTIVKQFLDKINGKIYIQSELNAGTSVKVEMPVEYPNN